VRLKKAIGEYSKNAQWPFPFDGIVCCEMPRRGRFFINALVLTGIDGADSTSLTRGMIEGRQQAKKLMEIMCKIAPGFENARLVRTSPMIGIRDSRRIVGQYKLKVDDLVQGRRFDDAIALSGYAWDMADPKKPSKQTMKDTPIPLPYVEIPYRILVPRGISNLIVAGRSISVEWQALGPIRIMPACFAMGQAAGTASAQVVKNSVPFKDIDVDLLRQELKKQGAILEL